MGVSADIHFKDDLNIGGVGGVGPVRVVTDPGHPFDVTAAVATPVPIHAAVDNIGHVGPVEISGIPDKFTIDIDIKHIPKIDIGLDPITVNPVGLNVSIKEIPSVRAHLPADFNLGLSILGLELLCVRLCGEAQIITEPYVANPCEHCGPQTAQVPTRIPVTPVTHTPAVGFTAPVAGNPLPFEEML
jgi:hypothetical protein